MERLKEMSSLEILRGANRSLSDFFSQFAGAPVLGSHDEVEAMLGIERTLRSVGALLESGVQKSDDADMRHELARYRENLLRLRHELGLMQDSATDARARLFTRANHLEAARAWCMVSRVTR